MKHAHSVFVLRVTILTTHSFAKPYISRYYWVNIENTDNKVKFHDIMSVILGMLFWWFWVDD